MNRTMILPAAGLIMLLSLTGCRSSDALNQKRASQTGETSAEAIETASTENEATENAFTETGELEWEPAEWKDIVLELPKAAEVTRGQDTFQSADQTAHNEYMGDVAGLELIINTQSGQWDGGSYQIGYYEITTDPEMATMIALDHAAQLREEYWSARNFPSGIFQETAETISLGEEPCQRSIRESKSVQDPDHSLKKQWTFFRDPHDYWRLTVTCREEQADEVFLHIRNSFDLKKLPEQIEAGEYTNWGDLEVQIPLPLTRTVTDDRFRKTDFEEMLKGSYIYTVNRWEGEEDGKRCVLTHVSVSSDGSDTLFNDFYPPHVLDGYEEERGYGSRNRQTANEVQVQGEAFVVREGRYPKKLNKSFYENADGDTVCSWTYWQNPCDMWSLEITAPEEEMEQFASRVDHSVRPRELTACSGTVNGTPEPTGYMFMKN